MPAATTPSDALSTPLDAARRSPYADFYDAHASSSVSDRPVLLSIGNCQAESLRAVLPVEVRSIRVPPVHELSAADLPHLDAWVRRTDLLVMQPVRDDYRGLPIGTSQLLAALPARAVAAVVPVIRSAGLYPRQVIIRPPSDPSLVPPLVPYHDLSVLLEAAGRGRVRLEPDPERSVRAVRAVHAESQAQLRRREQAHGAVPVSDLLEHPRFDLMRTINHPGNPVWLGLGQRVLDRLGVAAEVGDPGRPLLNAVHAPREQVVIEAFGLEGETTADWTVEGDTVTVDAMREAHLAWYASHPDAVAAGLERHRDVIAMLLA